MRAPSGIMPMLLVLSLWAPLATAQAPETTSRLTIGGLEPGPFKLERGGEPRVEEFDVRLVFSGTLCTPGGIAVTLAAPTVGDGSEAVRTTLDPPSLVFVIQGPYTSGPGAGEHNVSKPVTLTIEALEGSREKVEPAVQVTATTDGSGSTCTPPVPAAEAMATQTVFIVPPEDEGTPVPPGGDGDNGDGDDGDDDGGGGIPAVPTPLLALVLAGLALAFKRPAARR